VSGATHITAKASPLSVVFVRQAMVLDSQAREHKRLEKQHRRGAQQARQALASLKRDAAALGCPINIEGEAEEESHGPHDHTTHRTT
jgi:type II secretory pathway component PulJ